MKRTKNIKRVLSFKKSYTRQNKRPLLVLGGRWGDGQLKDSPQFYINEKSNYKEDSLGFRYL